MSTKTNFKRVALVAVAALGLGVLTSAAPASAAFTAGGISITSTAGTGTVAGVGICYVSANEKATVTTAASLVFTATTGGGYLKVDSGSGSFTAISGTTSPTINASGSTVTFPAATTDATATLKVSAVGTVRVTAYLTSNDSAIEAYAITVVSACAADSLSVAKSYFRAVTDSGNAITTNVDDSGATDVTEAAAYLKYDLRDAYGDPLETAGALTVTATTGAKVGVGASGTASTAVSATTGGAQYIKVESPTAGTPIATTVTVKFNDVTVGSRAITIRGLAKSIKVTGVTVGKSGVAAGTILVGNTSASTTNGAGYFAYQFLDAAGNVVTNSGYAAGASGVQATTDTGLTSLVTVAHSVVAPTTTTGSTSSGDGEYTCVGSTKSGTATIAVASYNSNLELITSAPFTATCGGVLDTWTVSLDKATYAPGEIGTVTITAKDANGALVADSEVLTGVSGNASIGGGAAFVAAPLSTDSFTSGKKTYKFIVGNEPGSYGGTFTITGATDTSAKTVQYTVSGGGGVTNADVLKAIVSLIASINKQIAALQKALLKR
jgi:hypothetical protein